MQDYSGPSRSKEAPGRLWSLGRPDFFRRRKALTIPNVLPLSSRFVTMLVLASSCLGGNREAGWNWVRNDGDAGWKAPVELSRSFKFTEAARFKPHRKG